jgi:hypothetical protein
MGRRERAYDYTAWKEQLKRIILCYTVSRRVIHTCNEQFFLPRRVKWHQIKLVARSTKSRDSSSPWEPRLPLTIFWLPYASLLCAGSCALMRSFLTQFRYKWFAEVHCKQLSTINACVLILRGKEITEVYLFFYLLILLVAMLVWAVDLDMLINCLTCYQEGPETACNQIMNELNTVLTF